MELVTWVLACLGAASSAVPAFLFFQRDLKADKFLAFIEKLARKGEFSKARKLCSAAPESPVSRLTEKALNLRLEATVLEEGDEVDYRSAPQTVPFEDRVRDALRPHLEVELDRQLRLALLAGLGGAAAVASLWPPWPGLATALGIGALAVALLALRMYGSIRSGLRLAMTRLPQLVLPADEMHR